MDFSIFSHAVTAFLAAVFAVGGNLIVKYLVSGKVTPDHLKKEDIAELKDELKKHLVSHSMHDKEFVDRADFEKHIHDCPIKDLVQDLTNHKLQHGRYDSEIFTRLDNIEKTMNHFATTFEKLTEKLNATEVTLSVAVNTMNSLLKTQQKMNQ